MINIVSLWKEVTYKISGSLNSAAYSLWIDTLLPVCVKDSTLILKTPSQATRATLSTRYKEMIKDFVFETNNQIKDIELVLEEDLKYFEKEIAEQSRVQKRDDEILTNGDTSSSTPISRYTFDNFVVGESNKLAYHAALSVAKTPGSSDGYLSFNPLYIYGGVGLGKTHLIHSIWNYLLENNPKLKVLYVAAEKLTNDYVEALTNSSSKSRSSFNMSAFRNKYRNIDVLMIEDVQFLQNKSGSQDMLFHIFNDLYQNSKQIILSSDRPPKEINSLEDRLRSRFEGGLLADISMPDIETRIAIIRKKILLENVAVPDDVVYFLAEQFDNNIRELEGALSKVILYSHLLNKKTPSLETAKEALRSVTQPNRAMDADDIINAVCSYLRVSKTDIISKKKTKDIAEARHMAIYLITDILSIPLVTIGQIFGGRDHTTIIHSRDFIAEKLKTDTYVAMQLKDIKGILNLGKKSI
jgi:chromosomal replication initiator protein